MTQDPFNPLGYGELKLGDDAGGDGVSDERRPAGDVDDPEDLLFAGDGEGAAPGRSGATFGEPAPFVVSASRSGVEAQDADDAWAPVEDDFVTDFAELGGSGEAAATQDHGSEAASAAFGIPSGPVKRNLLPEDRGSQDAQAQQPVRDRGEAGEAIGQRGAREPQRPGQHRQALPSTKDAPRYPMAGMHDQSRPIAWIVPVLILLSGVGTGTYLCSIDGMMIVGAFAIALSVVGAPLARVLMRP